MKSQAGGNLGSALRKLRLAKGWTLAELSDRSGVPLSTLSRVELGQNRLNHDKLLRLCRALDVDLTGLVSDQARAAPAVSGRRSVTRAGDGAAVRLGANRGQAAAHDLLAKAISPVMIEVSAPSLEAHGPFAELDGESYIFVLSGQIVLHSPHYAPLPLAAGDGVYFDGRAGFALTSASPARALLIAAGNPSLGI